jgi:hypothetical protein
VTSGLVFSEYFCFPCRNRFILICYIRDGSDQNKFGRKSEASHRPDQNGFSRSSEQTGERSDELKPEQVRLKSYGELS